MTNNEHNDAVLAEISKKLAEIEDLKATLKPADEVKIVTLQECNAGAREAHFAAYEQQQVIKAAVEEVVLKTTSPVKKASKNAAAKAETN